MHCRLFFLLMIPLAVGCGDDDKRDNASDTATEESETDDGGPDESDSDEVGSDDGSGTDEGQSEGGGSEDGSSDDSSTVEDTGSGSSVDADGGDPDTASTDSAGDTGVDTEEVLPPEEDAIDSELPYTCRSTTVGDEEADSDPEYVPNRNGLCIVTSEVNWKIDEGLIDGGDVAVALRDCIVIALQRIASGVGTEKCIPADESSFRNSETCWEALAEAEVDCGGPEVDVSGEDPPPTDPGGKSGPAGATGILMLSNADKEIGHAVTAKSSPTPGPAGEWTIRDSQSPCQNVVLTIEMETRTHDEGSESSGGEEPLETKTCVTTCTPDPTTRTECCDWLLTDDEGDPTEWCYDDFRKLRRETPSGGDDSPSGETDPGETEPS